VTILIHGEFFGVDEVFLEILQIIIIQCEPSFEDTIREPLLPLKEIEYLCEDSIVVH